MNKSTMQVRGLIALGMLILIFIMIITGVILWLAMLGVMNHPGLWSAASQIHPNVGIIMFILGMVHFITNKKMFLNDLKQLKGKEY
ncbi:MAG TPA: hypothetical protein PLK24_03105 [Atribacter sp.]|jgi:cytochrome b subunit of formate dehydrogenase|uniref:DUF4405 domain-containing protein n=1 Tax=Candidatus Atribacter allofermentans TaxID=1852833 RepID=A0A1V5T2M4_9BACT|nr:hypothetical protein [Atribacter sp.]MDD3713662.1 hypothetical protein [Atribacterota bacterium]OQA60864.1 MAG: hypothetical protein BWY41_00442 [Candidatus Atribacteria bacterium ADurb.Bin276]HHT09429.1 hypothetical protein [Candidatus Atribacteria bacterium]MDI9593711.1 hypothetical protein [Atribacterota bacterium]HOT05753.1 hypothetical protein [Atribacter sp.]